MDKQARHDVYPTVDRISAGTLPRSSQQPLTSSQLRTAERVSAQEPIEEVSRGMVATLNRYSHDLRGPLGVIIGFADLLALGSGGNLSTKQRELVAGVKHEALAIRDITDRMHAHKEPE